jgi:ubiquinone biosynthesis protein COQ9
MDIDAARDAILKALLPNVAFDGWMNDSLREAARTAGFGRDLAAVADRPLAEMRVRERIATLTRAYFEVLEPYREAHRRLIAHVSLPANMALGLRVLGRTVDDIWHAAGDEATDFSFYTKRALLASVVASTTFYWFDDASDDRIDTWAFLDRRLADVLGIGKAAARFRTLPNVLSAVPSPRRFARQMRDRCRRSVLAEG